MLWFFVSQIFSILVTLFSIGRKSDQKTDLEILVLRHHLDILLRTQQSPLRPSIAPIRKRSIGWQQLMAHYKEQVVACDFFTVEMIGLKTLYVLFYITSKCFTIAIGVIPLWNISVPSTTK